MVDSSDYLLIKKALLDGVLSKKELQAVDLDFAMHELDALLIRDPIANKYLNSKKVSIRSGEYKRIVKAVRAQLRRAHSLFEVGNSSEEYLRFIDSVGKVKNWKQLVEESQKILASHRSSEERLSDYNLLYLWISKTIGSIKSIVDLGCGLHPISICFLKKEDLIGMNYLAYDINKSEQEILNLFFSKVVSFVDNFSGEAKILNLRDVNIIQKLKLMKPVDLVFMLKLTDHLDRGKGHKATENVLVNLNTKYVLFSFPTVTRSGAPMRYPKRRWVEYLCERLDYSFESMQTKNELFYLVQK